VEFSRESVDQRTDVVIMTGADVIQLTVIAVVIVVVVVVVVRADAESFLVADRVPVVEPYALRPVELTTDGQLMGQWPAAPRRHCAVDRVLQTTTGVREPVRYLNSQVMSTSSPVSTGMGDRPSSYTTSVC